MKTLCLVAITCCLFAHAEARELSHAQALTHAALSAKADIIRGHDHIRDERREGAMARHDMATGNMAKAIGEEHRAQADGRLVRDYAMASHSAKAMENREIRAGWH